MIRKIFSLLPFALMAFGVVTAQVQQEPCGTTEANNSYREMAPDIAKVEQQLSEFIAQYIANMQSADGSRSKGTAFGPDDTLHIPVVVHVMHDYGAEYISDNAIYSMIEEINTVYLGRNSDLSQVISPFQPYIGNPKMRFHLASKDPKGRPTNGITRHQTYLANGGDDQAKFDQWDPSSYLNIWTTTRIGRAPASGQILAYAVFPSSAAQIPYTDGILTGYQFIGQDKTIQHEIGHILNLRHTWGNTPVATNCDGDDEVDDTPPTTGHFGNGNPFGTSAGSNCNNPLILYDTACTNNQSSLGRIILDTTLSPQVNTTDGLGFDYIPKTNLNLTSVSIYPNMIGQEFEITHYRNNTPIYVYGTKSDTVGLPALGSNTSVSSFTSPDLRAGMRVDLTKNIWIDSFSIYPTTIGDTFQVMLKRLSGDTIKLYTGVTTTATGRQVVPFGAFVPKSSAYRFYMSRNPGLRADSLTTAMFNNLENDNVRPVKRIPGVIDVLNYFDTTGQNNNIKGRYNYFYDIHIRYDALTNTDSTVQVIALDSFRATDVNATYSIRLTKNPGVYNDSVGGIPYVTDIPCVIEINNETTNGRYNNLYNLNIRYGYIKNCIDYPDTVNTQNIMDYSDCPIMFTKLQVARMRATLASKVGNRDNWVSDTTHVRTGILSQLGGTYYSPSSRPDVKPVPALSVEEATGVVSGQRTYFLCNTSAFQFRQRSWRDTVTSVSLSFSNGASKPTVSQSGTIQLGSTFDNSFSEPGWVDVTMTATGNNTGDSTTEFKNVVYAADGNKTINPLDGYYMDFEANDANNPIDEYPIFNYYKNDHRWQVMDNVGFTGSGCISYRNYDDRQGSEIYTGSPRGDRDDFYTPAFDLSGMQNECQLNFMTSGAFRVTDSRLMLDTLEISYSTTCGETWQRMARLTKGDIGNKGVVSIPYSPLYNGDWKLQSIQVPQMARQSKVFFRFRFLPGGDAINNTVLATRMVPGTGNHFYLDRININPYPAGVNTLLNEDKKIALAPNPTTGATKLIISTASTDAADITVTDVTGKVVYTVEHKLNGNINTIEIPASVVKVKGVYMVHVQVGNDKFTEKLVSY